MPKTVINLVKELGAKTTAEVMELLRDAGIDTTAEGFGVMSKVDDAIVAKLHALREGSLTKARTTTRRRLAEADPAELDLESKQVTRRAAKDFFGTQKVAEPAPPPKPSVPKTRPAPAPAQAKAQREAAVAPRRQAPEHAKPDLSAGPRIISMPDPEEAVKLKAQRESPAVAPARDKKKPTARQKERRREEESAGRRKRIKEIGVPLDEEPVRSRKRVFKVAGARLEAAPTVVPHIKITGSMALREVAKATGIKVAKIVRFLMEDLGIMANINYVASVEEIQLISENFGIKHTVALEQEPESELVHFEAVDRERLKSRPPVVTVMGHVDHGKTKLLDAIRKTNVVEGEAGGITQHIGAYQVEKKGKHITFIDTPGHEAFTAMRARGSQVTDVVILVVAADDGVMPQTVEAINHARAAEVPLIVAVNKIDKADANPERVKNQLAEHGLVPEEWGGDTIFVSVSALKAEGIDELLEMVLLTAELADPKADPIAPPFGVVIESKVDTGIGVVATVLIQQGTVIKGQFILSGTHVGRIKRMENDRGEEVTNAGPAMPVRIIGFSEPPENGDKVYSFKNKKQAAAIADQRQDDLRLKATAGASSRMSLEAFFEKAEAGEAKDLLLVIKADVGGSAEALEDSIKKIAVEGTTCTVVSSAVGQINETDVNLAAASGAVIVGFNVGISSTARRIAEREHVDVRLYDVIYKITEDIEKAMKGLLEPEYEEHDLGRVEVRAVFKTTRAGTVAGGYVLDGVAKRGAKYRLKRSGETVMDEGTLNSLKRFQDDAKEVASGFECGLLIEGTAAEEGDILELYEMVERERV